MQFFLIEIEIEISLLTKSVPQEGIYILQITIMIDTQQQYIKLNIQGEISIIVKNKFFMVRKFGKSHWSKSIFTGHGPPDHC